MPGGVFLRYVPLGGDGIAPGFSPLPVGYRHPGRARKMIQGKAAAMHKQGRLGGDGASTLAVDWSRSQWREAEVLEALLQYLAGEDLDSLAGELVIVSREARKLVGG